MNATPKKVRTKKRPFMSLGYDTGAIILMLVTALLITFLTIYATNLNRERIKPNQERGPTPAMKKREAYHQTIQRLEKQFIQYHKQANEKLIRQQRTLASQKKEEKQIGIQKLEAKNNYLKRFYEEDKKLYQSGIVSEEGYIKKLKNKINSVKHLVF